MAIFDFLSALISPVTDLIGKIVTKDEDKLTIKAEILRIQTALADKMLEYERSVLDSQTKIIVAEAQSESALTRNWRPLTALIFVGLATWAFVGRSFGINTPDLPPDLWTVIKIMVGGYTGGRTLEKVVPPIIDALKSKEKI